MNEQARKYDPLHVFNFEVVFNEVSVDANGNEVVGSQVKLCGGAFSEITGLEATMEPKVIKEGGRNFGVVQRVGPVTFATVVLKRGVSFVTDQWKWFQLVGGGAYSKRMNATITFKNPTRGKSLALYQWVLHRAMPVKFKAPDFNASASSIGIEELHIAHEGLEQVAMPADPKVSLVDLE